MNKEETREEEIQGLDEMQEASPQQPDWEDSYKRTLADYQNLQKRVSLERREMAKYGAEKAVMALLPVLDSFFYAGDNESIQAIYTSMLQALASVGLKTLKPNKGDVFDANYHEAVVQMETDNADIEVGCIADVLCPGYTLHEKLLKACQVAIAK